jgi:DNA-directed RNA polymerase subunit M/transcription elongation factor TFIIS
MSDNNAEAITIAPKKRIRRTKKEIEEQRRKDAEELQRKIDAGENIEVVKKKKGKGKGKGSVKKNIDEVKETTSDDIRREKVEYLMRQFPELSEIQCKDLEIGIYNFVIEYITKKGQYVSWNDLFIGLYKHKLMSVVNNMVKYEKLCEYIKEGVYKPHEIVFLKFDEIDPELWDDLFIKRDKEIKDLNEKKLDVNTDLYVCKKCKSRKINEKYAFLRSGDEGGVCMLTCTECNFQFRIYN